MHLPWFGRSRGVQAARLGWRRQPARTVLLSYARRYRRKYFRAVPTHGNVLELCCSRQLSSWCLLPQCCCSGLQLMCSGELQPFARWLGGHGVSRLFQLKETFASTCDNGGNDMPNKQRNAGMHMFNAKGHSTNKPCAAHQIGSKPETFVRPSNN